MNQLFIKSFKVSLLCVDAEELLLHVFMQHIYNSSLGWWGRGRGRDVRTCCASVEGQRVRVGLIDRGDCRNEMKMTFSRTLIFTPRLMDRGEG